jgi:hypothetical protein
MSQQHSTASYHFMGKFKLTENQHGSPSQLHCLFRKPDQAMVDLRSTRDPNGPLEDTRRYLDRH